MTRLPVISGDRCVKTLKKSGFYVKRQQGSHLILRKDDPLCQVAVPLHTTLDRGTLRGILRQANISADELINRL